MDITNQFPTKAFTHSGKFHSDDVFSAALLTYLNPDIVIERGYEVPNDYEGLVFDIGGGEYDHHQEGAPVRENDIPYAAFGLLWREYGATILSVEEAEHFDEGFVQALDLSDNTGSKNEIAEVISLFNPTWDSDKDTDQSFHEAKEMAFTILVKKFEHIESSRRAEGIVEEAIANTKNRIVILSQGVPWKKYIIGTDAEFVIYPSDRGGYCAQGVPIDRENKDLKIYFPEVWRGKRGEELRESSGIEGLHFCHKSGFLIATDTIEGAIKACETSQEENQEI